MAMEITSNYSSYVTSYTDSTKKVDMSGNGMLTHLSQMMVQRAENWMNGIGGTNDILGSTVQSAIRANFQIPRLLGLLADMLADWHKGLNGRKDIKEAETQLKNLQNYTRVIRYRGYTQKEYLNMQSPERMQRGKVIAFPGNKKIYPNDPCPCGSGKKYKKCCGKK